MAQNAFAGQNAKKLKVPAHFKRLDVQKSHAAVARSTCASQNVLNASAEARFLTLDFQK